MPAINRVPKALLSILDGQVQGNNPKDMEPLIRGIVSMDPLYFAAKGWEFVQVQSVLPGGIKGLCCQQVIPDGQMWFIRCLGATLFGGVGMVPASGVWTPIWLASNATTTQGTSMGNDHTVTTSDATVTKVGQHFETYFTAGAGESIAWWSGTEYANPVTIQANWSFVRFQA